jgi:hypothetical protein
MAEARMATYANIFPAKKTVIGSKVVNAQNEDLGKIDDIAIDVEAGRITYAVLSFEGFLGMGDKYFAIPWEAFRFNGTDKRAILDVEKRLLEKCPRFRPRQLAEHGRLHLGKPDLFPLRVQTVLE